MTKRVFCIPTYQERGQSVHIHSLFNNYSPKAKRLSVNIHRDEVEVNTEPSANNCFSINTQVIISKKRKKHFNAKSSSLTVAERLLAAILSVEVIIG